jgi:hypothetical protein
MPDSPMQALAIDQKSNPENATWDDFDHWLQKSG